MKEYKDKLFFFVMSDSENECENQEEINIENRLDNYFNKMVLVLHVLSVLYMKKEMKLLL